MRMVRMLRHAALTVLLAMLVAPPLLAQETEVKAAKVRMPKDFKYAGQVHEQGTYQVRIEAGEEGPYVVLATAEGTEIVRELAIVHGPGGRAGRASASVQVLTRDEQMLRVVIRHDAKMYLAYFEVLG